MNQETHAAPYTLPTYTREWVYTFLALAIGLTMYFKMQHPLTTKSALSPGAAPVPQESYWFFALRLPDPAPHYAPSEFYARTSDWLNSLRRAGFSPMLFSDVKERLSKGMLLPEKTIVISIDEALLTTFNAYVPLFKNFKIPAVLVTSVKPLNQGDHGYLSLNAVQKLPSTGAWDVILISDNAAPQLLSPQEAPVALTLPEKISPWSSMNDRSLANQLADLRRPHRLSIDWQWSGQDLVNRLEAETPVHPSGSHLGMRQIMDRPWGVTLSKEANREDRFSLQAPLDQRGADVEWLGTRGLEDFQIDFSVEEVTGELWFLLRSTNAHGSSIRVGFSNGNVIVKELSGDHEHLLGMTGWPHVFPWTGTIQLRGHDLSISHNDQTIMVSRVHLRTAHHSQAVLQLMLYDQLYGAAQARDVSLEITPLLSSDTDSTDAAL